MDEDIKKWLPMSPTEAGREAQKREVFMTDGSGGNVHTDMPG